MLKHMRSNRLEEILTGAGNQCCVGGSPLRASHVGIQRLRKLYPAQIVEQSGAKISVRGKFVALGGESSCCVLIRVDADVI